MLLIGNMLKKLRKGSVFYMPKDRQNTEQRLLQAAGEIVLEKGFSALGVNAVAQRAGVSKMLIYRYFGSLEGLLQEWALQHNFWAEVSDGTIQQIEAVAADDPGEQLREYGRLLSELFSQQADSLQSSLLHREVLRWILMEENEVNHKVLHRVEEMGVAITRAMRNKIDSSRDIEATVALLIGGIYYLSLMSDRTDVFNGIDLQSDMGWERIKASIDLLIELLLDTKLLDTKKERNEK